MNVSQAGHSPSEYHQPLTACRRTALGSVGMIHSLLRLSQRWFLNPQQLIISTKPPIPPPQARETIHLATKETLLRMAPRGSRRKVANRSKRRTAVVSLMAYKLDRPRRAEAIPMRLQGQTPLRQGMVLDQRLARKISFQGGTIKRPRRFSGRGRLRGNWRMSDRACSRVSPR